jgi:hypothetical protein
MPRTKSSRSVPTWLALVCISWVPACGRLDFDPLGGDAAAAPTPIAWVKVFGISGQDAGTTDNFVAQALQRGDAVLIHAYCGSSTEPTDAQVTAPGWAFTRLGPIAGSLSSQDWAASFGAVAPDTATTTFTVSWTTANCSFGLDTLGDEFMNNDPTGGTTTFVAQAEAVGMDDCVVPISPGVAGDAVWGGCSAGVRDTGPGFTKGADDGGGNWTEFRITSDSDGPSLPVTFANQPGHDFIITAATIKSR